MKCSADRLRERNAFHGSRPAGMWLAVRSVSPAVPGFTGLALIAVALAMLILGGLRYVEKAFLKTKVDKADEGGRAS